jgi:tetratricopeptide (TPR) repeat protein
MGSDFLRTAAGAIALALVLAGCAGSPPSPKSAKQACREANEDYPNPAQCDAYVEAAKQSGDRTDLFEAYSIRSVLWQMKGDLNLALHDADLAIEAQPELKYGHYWRAVLLGESGEYADALRMIRKMEYEETHSEFHADVAMLEYVTGDRVRSAAFFRSAARYASEVDRNEDSASYYRFNAAIIESELKAGDPTSIERSGADGSVTVLSRLWQYRIGQLTEADLRALIPEMTGPRTRNSACISYFAIGHKNALAGNVAVAKPAFEDAASKCTVDTFELHAARKWLKSLGG